MARFARQTNDAVINLPGPGSRFPASGSTRFRRSPWRGRLWLLACLLTLPMLLLASHRVLGQVAEARYAVSVPVDFQPYDPAMWSLVTADDFQTARTLADDLPDPLTIDPVADAPVEPPPANIAQLRQSDYVGPTAAPYVWRGVTATDTTRAHYCLTAVIYYEAASETDDGMRGVAQVVLNRARHPSFPGSICGVVFQGSDRAIVCQFTFACDGAMARRPSRDGWSRASRIAAEALSGRVFAPVGLATHYHTQAIWPRWGRSLVMTNVVGAHIFHRWRGRFGEPRAFSRPYSGREPPPGPYLSIAAQLAARAARANGASLASVNAVSPVPVTATLPTGAAMPVAPTTPPIEQPGFSGAVSPAAGSVAVAPPSPPAPSQYADPRLARSGTVRDEYRNSGSSVTR